MTNCEIKPVSTNKKYIHIKNTGGKMKNYSTILESANNLNKFNLIQNTRADIVGELDAIMQYENHIANSNDQVANRTWQDIANEEKVHVGQLFGLLFYLDPESQKFFEQGLNEFYSSNKIQ